MGVQQCIWFSPFLLTQTLQGSDGTAQAQDELACKLQLFSRKGCFKLSSLRFIPPPN